MIYLKGEEDFILFLTFTSIEQRGLRSLLPPRSHKWELGNGSLVYEFYFRENRRIKKKTPQD